MLEELAVWLVDRFRDIGYGGIVVLMAMESSVFPVPSELVMPPAGYLAAKGEMNFALAVASGVGGSILGSLATYGAAHWLGRPFVRRVGKVFLVPDRALERSERYFAAHGEISTFLARMLPVVRHLISIPAGIARMSLPKFVLYTGSGAFVWCTILTWIGYYVGQNEEAVRHYVNRAVMITIVAAAVLVVLYVRRHRRRTAAGNRG